MDIELSREQRQFIDLAMQGYNVLVDACIGSGKTTAIQALCAEYGRNKKILYLTYNKLLKLDAKDRVQNRNVTVTNYHGFAYTELSQRGIRVSVSDIMQTYVTKKPPLLRRYDVLILDEYQDLEQDLADMLRHIKDSNPGLQIIAVGDMAQKIYDKTRLDAWDFINEFLGFHYTLEFTQCFRISADHAQMLSEVWGKKITGVNPDCEIKTMTVRSVVKHLAKFKPGQILVLGSNSGKRDDILNELEEYKPDVFNKKTVWAKIHANDGGATEPTPEAAIFTTYDGCKGMEREICVVCDWDESYWNLRARKPNTRYEILRNIFCVAASRGKREIIFVKTKMPLDKYTLSTPFRTAMNFDDVSIDEMFDYKYAEDIEAAYKLLQVEEIKPEGREIDIPVNDGLIDLSPCIAVYAKAVYLTGFDINKHIEAALALWKSDSIRMDYYSWGLDMKILYLTTLQTKQYRYMYQVKTPLVGDEETAEIKERLAGYFYPDVACQLSCAMGFKDSRGMSGFTASGLADVDTGEAVCEIRFVDELSHPHFLQTACYMMALKRKTGYLLNVRTGQMFEIKIPDENALKIAVAKTATKGAMQMSSVADARQAQARQEKLERMAAAKPAVQAKPKRRLPNIPGGL